MFYENKPTTSPFQAQAPNFQLITEQNEKKTTQNHIINQDHKNKSNSWFIKGRQKLRMLPVFSNFIISTGSIKMSPHDIHANSQWLPGIRNPCPPWPYKPHFSSIKIQALGSSRNPTTTTKT
jgi:hypothetical protein